MMTPAEQLSQAFSLRGSVNSREGGIRRPSRRSSRRSSSRRSSRNAFSLRGSLKQALQEEDDEESRSSGSGSSLYSDESSYETESILTGKESSQQTFNIAAKETSQVRTWRTIMALVLVATAAAVIATTHVYLKKNEDNEFDHAVRFKYRKRLQSFVFI